MPMLWPQFWTKVATDRKIHGHFMKNHIDAAIFANTSRIHCHCFFFEIYQNTYSKNKDIMLNSRWLKI